MEIWQEVLGSERVGVNDNFFELGGHSLLATQVISRVRTEFNVEVPVQRIFETPTITGLALNIEGAQNTKQSVQSETMKGACPNEAGRILEHIDQLADEEVESLLKSLLAENAAVPDRSDAKAELTQNHTIKKEKQAGTIGKISRSAQDELLSKLDQLSDKEVDSLLHSMLIEENTQ